MQEDRSVLYTPQVKPGDMCDSATIFNALHRHLIKLILKKEFYLLTLY